MKRFLFILLLPLTVFAGDGCCDWEFSSRAQGVYMQRRHAADRVLVYSDSPEIVLSKFTQFSVTPLGAVPEGAASLLTSRDYTFDWKAGLDIQASLFNNCWCLGVDARVLWLDDFSANSNRNNVPFDQDTGRSSIIFNSADLGYFGFCQEPVNVTSSYTSSLLSAEANIFRPFGSYFNTFLGYRYIQINESYSMYWVDSFDPPFSTLYKADTTNDLHGLQIGLERSLDYVCWNFSGALKGGIYANDSSQNALFVNQEFGVTHHSESFKDSENAYAFAVEGQFRIAYSLTCALSLVAGYEALYVDRLALAVDQLQFSYIETGGSDGLDYNGSLFYHGVTFGLTGCW